MKLSNRNNIINSSSSSRRRRGPSLSVKGGQSVFCSILFLKVRLAVAAVVLLIFCAQISPSLARLNDISSSSKSSSSASASAASTPVSISHDIPPLQDTIELIRLSSLVYDFRPHHGQNCSAFPSIYEQFVKKEEQSTTRVLSKGADAITVTVTTVTGTGTGTGTGTSSNEGSTISKDTTFTFHCHMYERDDQDTQVLIISRTKISATDIGNNINKNNYEEAETTVHHANSDQDYIAIVYAGTDDFRNTLTDTNILTHQFGPGAYDKHDDNDNDNDNGNDNDDNNDTHIFNFPPKTDNIRVHAGFNNAVFKHQLFHRIYDRISTFRTNNPKTRILTTGHSLGASDAVLTAVALKLQPIFQNSNDVIHSINFGCPKTGNKHWRDFVNGMDGLGVWRVVNGLDLVPRLPGIRFHHVGHTVQLDRKEALGYWLHGGNRTLGYAGIPFGWNFKDQSMKTSMKSSMKLSIANWIFLCVRLIIALPYLLAPAAAYEHLIGHYSTYLYKKSTENPASYYIDGFETIHGGDQYYSDDDDDDDDDDGSGDNDDDKIDDDPIHDNGNLSYDNYWDSHEIAKQYAEDYRILFNEEQGRRDITNLQLISSLDSKEATSETTSATTTTAAATTAVY